MKLHDRECSFIIRAQTIMLDDNRLKAETTRVSPDVPRLEDIRKDIPEFPPFSLDHKTLSWYGIAISVYGLPTLFSITPVWKV